MKIKVLTTLLVFSFLLAGQSVFAQKSEREIKREIRKEIRQLKRDLRKTKNFTERDLKRILRETERIRDHAMEMHGYSQFWDKEEIEKIHEEAMEQQKMAMKIHEKELRKAMKSQKEVLAQAKVQQEQALRQAHKALEKAQLHRDFDFDFESFEVPDVKVDLYDDMKNVYVFSENQTFQVNKTLEVESLETEHNFTIDEGSDYVAFSVSGNLKEGEMTITINKPDGSEYKKIEINPMADVEWSKKVRISGEETEDLSGNWTVKLSADNATGNYKIKVNSR